MLRDPVGIGEGGVELILPQQRPLLNVSACPHPFDGRRVDYAVPVGLTIAEIVELIQPDPLLRMHGVAFIGEYSIARDRWHVVRPKPGALLSIRLLPSSGGGARIGIMIGIAILAIAVTVLTAGAAAPLDAALFAGAASMAGALARISHRSGCIGPRNLR